MDPKNYCHRISGSTVVSIRESKTTPTTATTLMVLHEQSHSNDLHSMEFTVSHSFPFICSQFNSFVHCSHWLMSYIFFN